ncbi:MAG: hypothetical protein IPG76_00330 [Acidobacteria bacterium]|nr:hypothetical protein [Acidobacteriota bacterium]
MQQARWQRFWELTRDVMSLIHADPSPVPDHRIANQLSVDTITWLFRHFTLSNALGNFGKGIVCFEGSVGV